MRQISRLPSSVLARQLWSSVTPWLGSTLGGMSATVDTPAVLDSWVSFQRSHAAVTRQLNAELLHAHGLTLNDYEVMLLLAKAPGGKMRRVDLAESVLLTASGITRLLGGLERTGLVAKAVCQSDARVSYAELTPAGHERLRQASATHLAGIAELFTSRFSADELAQLGTLLSRLPMTGKACGGGEAGACGI